jgi:MFS family permease
MTATGRGSPTTTSMAKRSADGQWRRFYVVGGVSAALYVLGALILPAILTFLLFPRFWEVLDDAPALLPWIADNALGWHVIQGATLESSIFLILAFVALWLALRHLDPVWAAVGAIVGITSQVLFMAYYPVLLGLAYLGEKYPTASGAEQQSLVAAAEGLVAQNSGFNPVYEALLAVGVIILSLVMLGGVFPRWVGYLGIVTGVAALAAIALHPVLGLSYLFWWVFLIAWLVAIAWYLARLGMRPAAAGGGA